ncbi:hypothetical protein Lesp02_48190 [Lentzea sp. NBRC 105346]|nr:hypothetical protein Lesp02_48190 [Lentzea sp. NBRC 105346]
MPKEHALYRPRHGERQRTALVSALIFFCVPVLLLIVGVKPEAFENRKLADFPAGWNFFGGLDRWATDHTPLRKQAVATERWISKEIFGETPKIGKKPAPIGPVPVPAPQTPTTTRDPSLDGPEPSAFAEVIEGKNDWLYYGFDVKGACQPTRSMDEVIGQLRKLRAAVESSGRKFVFVVAPNKTTMVPEFLPARYFGKDCAAKARDAFWQRIGPEAGAIDLRPGLDAAKERTKAPVYSKFDTHWTHDGGVVLTRAIAENIKPGVSTSWKVTDGRNVQLPGDLPPLLGEQNTVTLRSYKIAPDGISVATRPVPPSPTEPVHMTQSTGTGIIGGKVGMLGDSFTFYVGQYVVAPFSDITLQNSDRVPQDPTKVGAMLADKDVVVFEAAERSLVGGVNPLLDQGVIDRIAAELAKRPK